MKVTKILCGPVNQSKHSYSTEMCERLIYCSHQSNLWMSPTLQSDIFFLKETRSKKKRDKPSRRLLVIVLAQLAPSYIFMKIQGVCLHYALIFIALTFVLATYLKCLVTRNLHFSRKIIAFTTILYIKYNEGLSGEGSAEWAILFAPSPSSISWGRQQIALPLALGPVLDCKTELFIAKMPQPCAMTLGHR